MHTHIHVYVPAGHREVAPLMCTLVGSRREKQKGREEKRREVKRREERGEERRGEERRGEERRGEEST